MNVERIDDPDLPLADLMARWPETIPVFIRHRMMCVGCLVVPFHTVLDACAEYGLDVNRFYRELKVAITPLQMK